MALCTAGFSIFASLRGGLFTELNNRLVERLRARLFGVLIRRETSFFDTTDVGQLTSRLTSDCQSIARSLATNMNVALRNLVQVIGGSYYRKCRWSRLHLSRI